MNKATIVSITLLYLLILLTNLIYNSIIQAQSNENTISFQLYPAIYPTNFSLIGTYRNGSSEVTLYSQNASILASTDMWNIKYAQGNVNMSFYKNYLHTAINLYNLIETTPADVIAAYPNLLYGEEHWWGLGPTEELAYLKLPMLISNLPNFYSVINFSVYDVNGTIEDFSYDIWLTQNTPYPSSIGYPDIEVMIWMYHDVNLAGIFSYAGTLNVSTIVNGIVHNYSFQVYVRGSTSLTSWITVFLLSPVQLQGEIGIPIGYVLKSLPYYTSYAGLNFNTSDYYLDAIQLGMEFYANSNNYANLGYNIYSWKILLPISTSNYTTITATKTITSTTTTALTTTLTSSTGISLKAFYIAIILLIIIIVIFAVLLGIRRR